MTSWSLVMIQGIAQLLAGAAVQSVQGPSPYNRIFELEYRLNDEKVCYIAAKLSPCFSITRTATHTHTHTHTHILALDYESPDISLCLSLTYTLCRAFARTKR